MSRSIPPGVIERKLRMGMLLIPLLLATLYSTAYLMREHPVWAYAILLITTIIVALSIYYDTKFEKKVILEYDRRPEYCLDCKMMQDKGSHCTKCGNKLIPTPRCKKCDQKMDMAKDNLLWICHKSGNAELPTPHCSHCGEPIPQQNPFLGT